jgi:hypothetical protein
VNRPENATGTTKEEEDMAQKRKPTTKTSGTNRTAGKKGGK